MVKWTMHPWERDARMARKALKRGNQAYGLLIELACTRSSDELLGARRAYQSLYSESRKTLLAELKASNARLVPLLVKKKNMHQTIFEVYDHIFSYYI